ncbi:hypothetical protein TNCT_193021 [Trichonephila clavata]|uniref:Uncharacterized protein n=1 Tax=Trichonephila clavata TaxID=2740835 RepID=A0A8X6F3N8_TRICU|nr:hypothetical protein TNCT_193021 [Trichonephila clavata]
METLSSGLIGYRQCAQPRRLTSLQEGMNQKLSTEKSTVCSGLGQENGCRTRIIDNCGMNGHVASELSVVPAQCQKKKTNGIRPATHSNLNKCLSRLSMVSSCQQEGGIWISTQPSSRKTNTSCQRRRLSFPER